ncbi:FAD-dependent oxidoreductase [soil metagenome]
MLVVGAGITGSLAAEHLISRGHEVCVVDRERPGLGSTAASTAMLLWEIDRSLTYLTELYGFERAVSVYRRSLQAVSGLENLIRSRRIKCVLRNRNSLYLAAGSTRARELLAEHELRARAGLPGAYLDYRTLRSEFGFDREAAILSPSSADADPVCLSHELMAAAISKGAVLLDGDAVTYETIKDGVAVTLDDGHVIEARWVVLATGYVMPDFVKCDLHRISSSWAIATPPQATDDLWREGALIWEASDNYLYARTTADHRIILGGEDEDSIVEPDERKAATPAKAEALLARLSMLVPQADARADFIWSGAFGTTADGLPLIGPVPGHPRVLAAYGYGGNGITFAFIASRLVADVIAGRRQAWGDEFALDRPLPTASQVSAS